VAAQLEPAWTAAQARLATLVPDARYVLAAESGHYIQLDQPELVIDAIRDVVAAVRAQDGWAGTPIQLPR
jgi:pimeloyl-ACP methyl ester carboxylesterase